MTQPVNAPTDPEHTGITLPLSRQINLLGRVLGRAIEEQAGPDMLARVEELRQRCKRAIEEENLALRAEAADEISGLSREEIVWLLRAFTAFFHLVNQAEQQEIVRINRERAQQSTAEAPRAESIDEAIFRLKEQGCSLDEVMSLIQRLDIQPTMTAHPTEARRRSILYKQQQIAALLTRLRSPALTPAEREAAHVDLHSQIALLLATDEVRAERPTVAGEVEQGLYFVRNAIWDTLPRIHHDVEQAIERHYGARPDLPAFLQFRSWIGSDRDGNPNVTSEVTRATAREQRRLVLELYYDELREARRALSISDRQVATPQVLLDSIEQDAQEITLPAQWERSYQHEPYRRKLSFMMQRIEGLLSHASAPDDTPLPPELAPYTAERFLADLKVIKDALEESPIGDVVRFGPFDRLLVHARTFGFHLLALDVRQHSRVHEEAVAALLRLAGVTEDYASLSEDERLEVLSAELHNPRPLLPRGVPLPDTAQQVLESFEVIRDLKAVEPDAVGSYIVSMTHAVSDLLEVLLLAKEVGLWRYDGETVHSPLDVAPLFETIEDLERADAFMADLFDHDLYARHLEARGTFQEIMLGYSDSNKDGGYWMANWALHKAQGRLGRVCREHGVDFRLFHGRGGTVGRGGGRANQAILAMPHACHNGRIRFTEQGEVISFRYALSDIARRHLEQIVHAMILSTAPEPPSEYDAQEGPVADLMEDVAEDTMRAYRALIDDPDLWTWYTEVTPIEQISRLPIASRPVSRKGANEVDFEGLRAIPWVFAWTQTRYIVPGWYGLGAGLADRVEDETTLERMRRAYDAWPFFRAVINNAQREMGRARFAIARHYADLAEDGEPYHDLIRSDRDRAREAILAITGQHELLENSPVIQKSIRLRNPYTDVLNLLQIELIRRYRSAPDDEKETFRQALFLSINGLAAAMQSTG